MRLIRWLLLAALPLGGALLALLVLALNPWGRPSLVEAGGPISVGPNEPTAVGTPNEFLEPTRAFVSEGGCGATTNCAVVDQGKVGEYKGFGFNIPPAESISGIEVTIGADPRASTDQPQIRLLDASETPVGGSRTITLLGGGGYKEQTAGDPGDLWGAPWTPADINNANFGVEIRDDAGVSGGGFDLDYIRITVYIQDEDGDGVSDPQDLCQGTDPGDIVDANGCSDAQVDADGDGVCDPGAPSTGPSGCTGSDNCPNTANPGQEDFDGDGVGDVCDDDIDGDGVLNASDECEFTPLGEPVDSGGCGDSQIDEDGDGVCNPGAPARPQCSGSDNCPSTSNPNQTNTDAALGAAGAERNGVPIGDGLGDACDNDDDDDGFTDAIEEALPTNPLDNCYGAPSFSPPGLDPLVANDAWPADFNSNRTVEVDNDPSISHDMNVVIAMFGAPFDTPLARRADLNGDGSVTLSDVLVESSFAGQACQ